MGFGAAVNTYIAAISERWNNMFGTAYFKPEWAERCSLG